MVENGRTGWCPESIDSITLLERAKDLIRSIPDHRVQSFLDRCVSAILEGEDPRSDLGALPEELHRQRIARRNYWIREAYRLVDGNDRTSRCRNLSKEIRRFESGRWIRWRAIGRAPNDVGALQKCLFNALSNGKSIKFRQLFEVCRAVELGSDCIGSMQKSNQGGIPPDKINQIRNI